MKRGTNCWRSLELSAVYTDCSVNTTGIYDSSYSSLAYCRCNSISTAFLDKPCSYCDANHYIQNNGCASCPCMDDVNNVSRCGTAPFKNTSVTNCKMSSSYTFSDSTGNYQFQSPCDYSL
jgi:hypothetical protein